MSTEYIKFIIDDKEDLRRIDIFLSGVFENFSRSQIQHMIKKSCVKVNNNPTKSSYILKENDLIECFNFETELKKIPSQNIPLDVVYEDDNMLVINKPSGMLTHPTTKEMTDTLVNSLKYKYKDNLSNINGEFRLGIIHRLDRNTSGLLMIAKNNKAHEFLAAQIQNRIAIKKYLAVVKGKILEDMILDYPIARSLSQPQKMEVNFDAGKPSLTKLRVLKNFSDATLVELTLCTGRTHQIRVHLSYIGHPVYNDTLYGFGKMKIKTDEQVLQSYKLTFTKPYGDEIIELEIPKDEKLIRVLNFLEQNELKEK